MNLQKLSHAILFAAISISYTDALGQGASQQGWGFSLGSGEPILLEETREGAPSISLKPNVNFGMTYLRRISDKVYLETGATFSRGNLTVTAAPNPDVSFGKAKYNLQMIDIPLFVRLNFSKHFFANAGLLADVDVSSKPYIARQSGIGSGLSLGGQISLSNNVTLWLTPYLQLHNLLSWEGSDHKQRVAEAGFRLGLTVWKD